MNEGPAIFSPSLKGGRTAIDVADIPENGSFRVTATVFSQGNPLTDSVSIAVLGAP